MNETTFLKENKRGPILTEVSDNVEPYDPTPIMEEPAIVDTLGIRNDFMVDKDISVKARSVDDFIKRAVENEQLRDSLVSYKTILDRFVARLPQPLEQMVRGKRGLEVLDFLFKEAAITNSLSSETYLKQNREHYKKQRVQHLLQELKQAIA